MESIQFRGADSQLMQALSSQLADDLKQAGLDQELQVGPIATQSQPDTTRGDPVTWTTVALAAVGAGGALSVLLGKDGFLSALARVLEKYIERNQAEVLIETKNGIIKIKGPVGEIKAILKQARD